MSLARRSLRSATWYYAFSPPRLAVLFGRSVLLSRWVPVPVFGVYALAAAIVRISVLAAGFGMGGAFLNRAPETEDEEGAAAALFTLRLVFATVWAMVLCAFAWFQPRADLRAALLVLTATGFVAEMVATPRLVLLRRVVHRRIAVARAVSDLAGSVVAVVLAWRGAGIWALLAVDVTIAVVTVLAYLVWRPAWRVRLDWRPDIFRYYLRFGRTHFPALSLATLLDRLDDLWLGSFGGDVLLGLYSRAYRFARYPSTVVAAPVEPVATGAYAELKGERAGLSRAFFRLNAFLVRAGFLAAGALVLVAPEFIRIFLTSKWLPMVPTLRLLTVFAMLEPLKATVANLFTVNGRPGTVLRARVLQLVVLVVGLFSLGTALGSAGVAISVNLMLVVGLGFLFAQARQLVDFSLKELFVVPTAAVLVGLAAGRAAIEIPGVLGSDWRTGTVKLAAFAIAFGAVMLAFERQRSIAIAMEALQRAGFRSRAPGGSSR